MSKLKITKMRTGYGDESIYGLSFDDRRPYTSKTFKTKSGAERYAKKKGYDFF